MKGILEEGIYRKLALPAFQYAPRVPFARFSKPGIRLYNTNMSYALP